MPEKHIPIEFLTDAEVRAQLEAHSRPAVSSRSVTFNPLSALVEDAERALGYKEVGSADAPHRIKVPAMSRVAVSLSQLIADGNPSPNIYGTTERPTGETLPLDPRAVIEQYSIVAQAGTRIIIATPRDKAVPVNGEKLTGLMGFYQDPQLVRNVDPAPFATLADGTDAPVSPIPTHDAIFTWPDVATAAFRTTITRAQNRMLGGGEDLRAALLDAIFRGVAEYCDSLLLAALTAAAPAAFTFGGVAAQHLKFSDLRAVCGTSGTGAFVDAKGNLVALPTNAIGYQSGGIPAELSAMTASTFIGAFGTAAVAIWPELTVNARRLSTAGDMELTCLVNAQAVLPNVNKFWSVVTS